MKYLGLPTLDVSQNFHLDETLGQTEKCHQTTVQCVSLLALGFLKMNRKVSPERCNH